MKDFRWWTTKALTQAEIDKVYANDSGAPTPSYWLKMDEGTGNPVDKTGGVLTGTLTGGAVWTTVAQTIANINTSPIAVTWMDSGGLAQSVGKLSASESFPIWLKLVVNANAAATPVMDDGSIFTVEFDIPQGGTGSGGTGGSGGGTGGNPPPASTDYKIAFIGDEGCESATDDCIKLIQDGNYDYTVSVGDHAYEAAGCWTGRFDTLLPDFNSAYGNHEYSENGGTTPYKSFFGHSKTYFTFQFQNIFFLVIDTNIDSDVGSAQHNFIVSELDRIKNDGSITWKIAVMASSMVRSYGPWNQ